MKLLEDDHQKLAQLLERLQAGLRQDGNAAELFKLLDSFWALLAVHIRAEHLWLFPAISNADQRLFGSPTAPSYEEAESAIAGLKADHNFFMDELAQAVQSFRKILAAAPDDRSFSLELASIRDRVDAVAQRLESHNTLEEAAVYRWPALVLSADEFAEIGAGMKRELDNLPPRLDRS